MLLMVKYILLKSIGNGKCDDAPLNWDKQQRCEQVIKSADTIGAKPFIKVSDITSGKKNLNLAFTAQLYNTAPALDSVDANEEKELAGLMDDDEGDSREERAFSMCNTLGLGENCYMSNLFEDCQDGLISLKVIDNALKVLVLYFINS